MVEIRNGNITKETFYENICTSIRRSIHQLYSLTISEIIVLKARTIKKTTSGKVARSHCKKAYLEKSLSSVYVSCLSKGMHNLLENHKPTCNALLSQSNTIKPLTIDNII